MKPISLNGHTRALTMIKYNREGDLLFSVAKDNSPTVWYTHNGERIGTFEGHAGTVWCLDVDYTSTYFVTGSADNTVKLWNVHSGECLATIETPSPVRSVAFSVDGKSFAFVTDAAMKAPCTITVVDTQQVIENGSEVEPIAKLPIMDTLKNKEKKVTKCIWGIDGIITGHGNGDILLWTVDDLKRGRPSKVSSEHKGPITDLQFSSDYLFFLSASKDHAAKLFDGETFQCLKTYVSDRPVNAASLSPTHSHVILGGGQEARDVTTQGKSGKFDAKIFHKLTAEELGRIKGHFGPINTIAFLPDGSGYASGGEDGYVRMHKFDDVYYQLEKL